MPPISLRHHTDRTLYLVVAGVGALLAAVQLADGLEGMAEIAFFGVLSCLVVLGAVQVWALTARGRPCVSRHALPLMLAATALGAQWSGHFSMQA